MSDAAERVNAAETRVGVAFAALDMREPDPVKKPVLADNGVRTLGVTLMTALNQFRPEFWDHQGCQLCETEQYVAAIAAFDQAITLDPAYGKAWNHRGNALSGLKRQAEALNSYDRAIAIAPSDHQAWFNRALLLTEMAAYGNAVESYNRAIALAPDPVYQHGRAAIWLKHKLV